jgi:hypothetical protein
VAQGWCNQLETGVGRGTGTKVDSMEGNVSHLGTWVKRATFQDDGWVRGWLETISEGKIRREERVRSSGRGGCT